MYGCSRMFRHYIAILRERSLCLLRDAQLRSSRQNIVDGRVVSSDVVRTLIASNLRGTDAARMTDNSGKKYIQSLNTQTCYFVPAFPIWIS
jgi:hypothetical protein